MDNHYISNLKFINPATETGFQYFLNAWVLKSYGVEDPIQLISLGLSYTCLWKALVDRVVFKRYRNPTTCQILGAWTEILIIFLSSVVMTLAGFADESTPPWISFVSFIVFDGGHFLIFLLGVLLPKTIFMKISNWQGQIPFHYMYIYLDLYSFSSCYWSFMVIFLSTMLQSFRELLLNVSFPVGQIKHLA